jgi:hypothetical protein
MKRLVEGQEREQTTLLPERPEYWVDEDNSVRVIDVFVDTRDLGGWGFFGVDPKSTGRPAYHPRVGFLVTNLPLEPEQVFGFYNQRGTAKQYIKEGKIALKWT